MYKSLMFSIGKVVCVSLIGILLPLMASAAQWPAVSCVANNPLPVNSKIGISYPVQYVCYNNSAEAKSFSFVPSVRGNTGQFIPNVFNSTCSGALGANQTCLYSGEFIPHVTGVHEIIANISYANGAVSSIPSTLTQTVA